MKKLTVVLLALVLVLAVFAGCSKKEEAAAPAASDAGNETAEGNVIYVGIFEPASGGNGAGGKQETLGIRYANSLKNTVTIDGTEYAVELVEVDNQSDTAAAITAAQSLVSSGVSIVVGSYGSGVSIAAVDTFADASIPAIGASCTNPNVTLGNDFYYRVCFLDPFQGSVMANFAFDKGLRNAAVLTEAGDDYSQGLGNYFAEAFVALGGTVTEVQFQTGETDFSATMASLASAGIDVLFAPSSIESAPYIIKQARTAGITCPIMAGDTWENETIITNSGDAATDVFLSTFFDENDTSSTAASEFVTGFKAWLNEDAVRKTNNGDSDGVAAVSALGFDAYNAALAAIEAAGSTDGEAICAALDTLEIEGVTGSISFDENGDARKNMAYIKTIEDGAFKFIMTQTVK